MAIEAPEKPTTATPDPDAPRSQFAGRVNTQQTGATLSGLRNAEDMIIPGVEDVVEESVSHHKPEGSDPLSDQTMILNMGPQHPSTHGVLRLVIEVDGETVISMAPDIGYLHTGIEKTCEAKFYAQVTPLTDRIDYLAPMTNNTAYALAVEKLLELEIPPRAQWLRVLFNELMRINSHLVWLGTHAMDIGALTVFLYCFREREQLMRVFEAVSGQRMMTSYIRIGGVAMEPPLGLFDTIRKFLVSFPSKIDEYEGLLNGNPIWQGRLKGVGWISQEDAIALGVSGPPLRASGVDFDLRRDMPYSSYEKFQFKVPISNDGDVWARYIVRMEEMRESDEDLPAGAGRHARGPLCCRRAEDHPSGPRADEDADGVADPSLQDRHGGLPGSGGRGDLVGRSAARHDELLRRLRRHGEAVPRAHAQRGLRQPAGFGSDVQGQAHRGCRRGDRVIGYCAGGDRSIAPSTPNSGPPGRLCFAVTQPLTDSTQRSTQLLK